MQALIAEMHSAGLQALREASAATRESINQDVKGEQLAPLFEADPCDALQHYSSTNMSEETARNLAAIALASLGSSAREQLAPIFKTFFDSGTSNYASARITWWLAYGFAGMLKDPGNNAGFAPWSGDGLPTPLDPASPAYACLAALYTSDRYSTLFVPDIPSGLTAKYRAGLL